MKLAVAMALICLLSGSVLARDSISRKNLLRTAYSSDACIVNCASQAESCKRVCPTTFNVPCLSACDSQAQTCKQGCRAK